jgi:hypothetical protein
MGTWGEMGWEMGVQTFVLSSEMANQGIFNFIFYDNFNFAFAVV